MTLVATCCAQSGHYGKLSKFVEYDAALDLAPFRAVGAIDVGPAGYSLYGVLVHQDYMNSTAFGHYISLVKLGGNWFECDDQLVRKVRPSPEGQDDSP